jgi:hypothetical protein
MGRAAKRRRQQKDRRIFEHQVEPALENLGQESTQVFRPRPYVIDPIIDQRWERFKNRVTKLKARLTNPKLKDEVTEKTRINTINVGIPTGYYIIVGRGAAAVVNHTTLRQTDWGRTRIGDLPVMHIGMRDPWLFYHEHGMGQPPYLLRMPGYHFPPALDSPTIRSGLSSAVFSDSTERELDLLFSKFQAYAFEGWVAAAESQTKRAPIATRDDLETLGLDREAIDARLDMAWPINYPPYRLLVVGTDESVQIVYAEKIDFCSGGGAGRIKPREAWMVPAQLLADADTKPWNPSYKWTLTQKRRPIIHGLDGLTEATEWADGQRVCVYGSGGIGLNQIERSHDEGANKSIHLDWYARDFLHDPTLNLRRNDTVMKSSTKVFGDNDFPFMNAGEADAVRTSPTAFNTGFHIVPGSRNWRWAHHAKIREVTVPGKLQIKLYLRTDVVAGLVLAADGWIEDFWAAVEQVDTGNRRFGFSNQYVVSNGTTVASSGGGDLYDRLILCLGQQQDLPGEPRKVAAGFTFDFVLYRKRMVGLQAEGGDLRILGAAAAMFAGNAGKKPFDNMALYRGSLPASAVPPGFILAGSNIAAANGFFTEDEPNRNFNTSSQEELTDVLEPVLGDWMLAVEVASEIVKLRQWPENGIPTMQDLRNGMGAKWGNVNTRLEFLKNLSDTLSLDYRLPDDWS